MSNELKDYIRDCEVEIISKINPKLGEIYKKYYYSDETDSIYGDDIKHPLSMKWTIREGVEKGLISKKDIEVGDEYGYADHIEMRLLNYFD